MKVASRSQTKGRRPDHWLTSRRPAMATSGRARATPRTLCSTTASNLYGCEMQGHLPVGAEIAAHGWWTPARSATPVNVTDATPVVKASERAASTIAAARWRFFSAVWVRGGR